MNDQQPSTLDLTDGSWADPLTRKERAELARKLARACKRAFDARLDVADIYRCKHLVVARTSTSAEMAELHLDVTERAKVAAA